MYMEGWCGMNPPHNDRAVHAIWDGAIRTPSQDRALSLREGALIQTFPMNYRFIPKNGEIKMGTISTHIGNAVPLIWGKLLEKPFLSIFRRK